MQIYSGVLPAFLHRTGSTGGPVKLRPSPSAGPAPKSSQTKKKGPPPPWSHCAWPLIIGFALAIFAPKIHEALSAYPEWVSWWVFPFMAVAGRPEIGLDEELARTLPGLMMVLQFPLESLLTMFNLRRRHTLAIAAAQIFFLHFIAFFVLWLLSQQAGEKQ